MALSKQLSQASRRSQDRFRRVAEQVGKMRSRNNGAMLQQALKAKSVRHDESKPWRHRVLEARALLDGIGAAGASIFASQALGIQEIPQAFELPPVGAPGTCSSASWIPSLPGGCVRRPDCAGRGRRSRSGRGRAGPVRPAAMCLSRACRQ